MIALKQQIHVGFTYYKEKHMQIHRSNYHTAHNPDFHSFQYFMSVVPTTYIDNSNNVLETYQYAVTDSSKSFTEMEALYNVPGIFFKYDFEPISVRITEKRQSFSHFLVRLSGIIGGAVVCVGFAYRVVRFILTGGKENPDMYAGVHNLMKSV